MVERISCHWYVGNKHLLRCDDMWNQLLKHFYRNGCITDVKKFLHSRNRIMQQRPPQAVLGQQFGHQVPYSAREQQYRYQRQQYQNATAGSDRHYSHGEQRPRQVYHEGPRRDSSRPGPSLG